MEIIEVKPGPTIRESGDKKLIERVRIHLGEEFLDMTVEQAAQFDAGDLGDSDPRSRASHKAYGEETARGSRGSGKHKTTA